MHGGNLWHLDQLPDMSGQDSHHGPVYIYEDTTQSHKYVHKLYNTSTE